MKQALIVGLGGAIGSIARWALGGAILHRLPNLKFPLGTFAVNILGCLLIGIIAGLAERRGVFSSDARLFLMTGLCGGFTTFSAFSVEMAAMMERGELAAAAAYAVSSVAGALLLLFAGLWLARTAAA